MLTYDRTSHLLTLLKSSTTSNSTKLLNQILARATTIGLLKSSTTLTLNSFLRAYTKSPRPIQAIHLYNHIRRSRSLLPDHRTFPALLKACTKLPSLPKGRETHCHVIKLGLARDIFVENSLIDLYGELIRVIDARKVFDEMPHRDLTSWNCILKAYVCSPRVSDEAYALFQEMVRNDVGVDDITLATIMLRHNQSGLEHGRVIHAYVLKNGFSLVGKIGNAIMDSYARRGDVVAAFRLFSQMKVRDVASHTILINGYLKLGLVDNARAIFDEMHSRDHIAWNSMINGYVKASRIKNALELFEQMEDEMIKPDEFTMNSLIMACAQSTDLQLGQSIHRFIRRQGIKEDLFLGTALIDMYAKCGSLTDAVLTFSKMEIKDVYTWTALISGFSVNARGREALRLFAQMRREGVEPNEAIFVAVLMACSHAGLVDEGRYRFNEMVNVYKIRPKIEHLGCMVDLLSRAGLLYEAEEIIKETPIRDRVIPYKTLLSACISYGDVDLGEKVAKELIEMDTRSHGVYVLLSNFYAFAKRWDGVEYTRNILRRSEIRKGAGTSHVEADGGFEHFGTSTSR